MGIEFNVDQALAKLGDLVAAHGPQAVEMAAQVKRVDAIEMLSGGPAWGIVAYVAWLAAKRCRKAWKEATYDDDLMLGIGTGICYAAAFAFLVQAIYSISNVWSWVALFDPKLALAHVIMQRIAGQ